MEVAGHPGAFLLDREEGVLLRWRTRSRLRSISGPLPNIAKRPRSTPSESPMPSTPCHHRGDHLRARTPRRRPGRRRAAAPSARGSSVIRGDGDVDGGGQAVDGERPRRRPPSANSAADDGQRPRWTSASAETRCARQGTGPQERRRRSHTRMPREGDQSPIQPADRARGRPTRRGTAGARKTIQTPAPARMTIEPGRRTGRRGRAWSRASHDTAVTPARCRLRNRHAAPPAKTASHAATLTTTPTASRHRSAARARAD